MSIHDTRDGNLVELSPELIDDTDDVHFVPAPCQIACPVGTDAPSYIAYIWEEKYEEAFEAIYATNPFSSICGRVCDAPCEPACRRADSDGPIAIRNLKRFIMDKLGRDRHLPPIEVARKETIGIVGSGPAGLTAAQDLAEAGYEVHVYELTDRLGGMMIWGIPAFRMPPEIIEEDMNRMLKHCPGIRVHLNTALGRDVSLAELKARHDAVLLAIGAWWGKAMNIPGEDSPHVVDGVSFLRRVNGGERPELPESVIVVGGGDVSMDACRVAKRLPGCKDVKVVYRRGPSEIPARRDELEGAIEEGIEFLYHTQQIEVIPDGNGVRLRCVETTQGEPGDDGRPLPVPVPRTEHDLRCGMVIAAVGQKAESAELDNLKMMDLDRVRGDFDTMRTTDRKVFVAGDGAFGGSTIVIAMHHGHKAAYYIKAFLEGNENPIPYRTPHRTRRVPVAQDLEWELLPRQHQDFHGLGADPVSFPEIESTYDLAAAKREAARCYRCDAETGSADYSVAHREDIFRMARADPEDAGRQRELLAVRMKPRDNPFPDARPAHLDDLVFLPANLSRLVIDPYREACAVGVTLADKLALDRPFVVTGFDEAPDEVRVSVAAGLAEAGSSYLGARAIGADAAWWQLLGPGSEPSAGAEALIYATGIGFHPPDVGRPRDERLLGLAVSTPAALEEAIAFALENEFDALLVDGTGGLGSEWPELAGAPNLAMLRDAVRILHRLNREEDIELIHFGGARSGTDAAKLIALGCRAVVYAMPVGLAAGGEIGDGRGLTFASNYTDEDRRTAVANILAACAAEASMMARCTGKTNLHNLEPEDLSALTLATSAATGIRLAGQH